MEAARTVFRCRETAAAMFDCSPEQVAFTSNCTHGLNIAIRSLVKPGGRVVISGFEHNAVTRVLHSLGTETMVAGEKLFDRQDTLERFEDALKQQPDAAVFLHVSNVFGYRLPAEELAALVKKTRLTFGVMHTYVGYPMVKLARDLVARGDLGRVAKVVVQYPQGWMRRVDPKKTTVERLRWRMNPKTSGMSGCMADIGTHAANLAEYITGLKIREVLAELTNFVGGALDDDGNVLVHFEKGAKGVLIASQISTGEENGLRIRVYGEKKALAWRQEDPHFLSVFSPGAPEEKWKRGNPYVAEVSPAAARCNRTPAGHPEAFLEAFADNYLNFCDTIRAKSERRKPTALELDFPDSCDITHDNIRETITEK